MLETPEWFVWISVLVAVRVLCALELPVADCDETYNFIEPLHFVLFGSHGMQTWEYSPSFQLRSYAFVWLYGVPAACVKYALGWLFPTAISPMQLKVAVYYGLRIATGMASLTAELWFVQRGVPLLFHSTTASLSQARTLQRLALWVLTFATPIAHAGISMLPTSFCMSLYFVALVFWLRLGHPQQSASDTTWACVAGGIGSVVSVALLGWPFAVALALPMALHFAWKAFTLSVFWSIACLVTLGVTVGMFDGYFYCTTFVCAACEIVRYNVFGGGGTDDGERGSHLYGVEPWHYFFRNLLLQFNVVFAVAIAVWPLILLSRVARWAISKTTTSTSSVRQSVVAALRVTWFGGAPFYLWFGMWLLVPHKEERFMVPAFPFLFTIAVGALGVLWGVDAAQAAGSGPLADGTVKRNVLAHQPLAPRSRLVLKRVVVVTLLMFALLSVGRRQALVRYYGGPQAQWTAAACEHGHFTHQVAQRTITEDAATIMPFDSATSSSTFTAARAVVCVGAEWYRFPTHFFLPPNVTYRFLNTTSFQGALPLPFAASTCTDRSADFNDLNRPNDGQFVSAEASSTVCDFVWDSMPTAGILMSSDDIVNRWIETRGWDPRQFTEVVIGADDIIHHTEWFPPRTPFRLLDVDRTPTWCRVLSLPQWVQYGVQRLRGGGTKDSTLGFPADDCASWNALVIGKNRRASPAQTI